MEMATTMANLPTHIKVPEESYLHFQYLLFCFLGVWPPYFQPVDDANSKKETIMRYLKVQLYDMYSIALISSMLIQLSMEAIDIYINFQDLLRVAEVAPLFILNVCCVTKTGSVWARKNKMAALYDWLERIKENSLMLNPEFAAKELATSDRRRKVYALWWIAGPALAVLDWVVKPLSILVVNSVKEYNSNSTSTRSFKTMPFHSWYPFDPTEPNLLYAYMFVFQIFSGAGFVFYNIFFDASYIGLCEFIISQFKILKASFEDLKLTKVKDGGYEPTKFEKKVLEKELNKCVRHHQQLLSFVSEMDEFYSPVMLVQFLMTTGVSCFLAFESSLLLGSPDGQHRLVNILEFLALTVAQLYINCWYGSQITWQSLNLDEAVFFIDWREASESFKLSLRIIITRTHHPLLLTGGKFYNVALDTFTSIMGASISYFSFLQTVNGKTEKEE